MLRNSYFNVATIRQQYSSRGLKVINKSAVGFSRGPKLAFMLKGACTFHQNSSATRV